MKKTVLITGASSGIGKASALKFHAAGWQVVATMRKPEEADWAPSGPGFMTACLDVTDTGSIRGAVDGALNRFGRLDAVVNNAGYGLVGPFEASTPEQVERQFQTNVFGLMNVCREIIPHMRDRRGGTIINVASMGGRITFPLYSVYHATKWAVEGFTESLQYELEPFGVRVKIIEPGPIRTDFYDRSMDLMAKPGLTSYDGYVEKTMPNMQKAGYTAPGPELVAQAIYRAATDNSARMRYSPNSASILALRRVLPERAFYSIVRKAVAR